MPTQKKILVVDDDIDLLEQVALILRGAGYEVVTAQGQESAEEALLTHIPALCIVDLMMEHTDSGFILCHNIKRLYPDVPVIILTAVKAATGLDFAARSSEAASWVRADALMDKPVRAEQIRAEVKRLLHE